jgi:hypothetical protein
MSKAGPQRRWRRTYTRARGCFVGHAVAVAVLCGVYASAAWATTYDVHPVFGSGTATASYPANADSNGGSTLTTRFTPSQINPGDPFEFEATAVHRHKIPAGDPCTSDPGFTTPDPFTSYPFTRVAAGKTLFDTTLGGVNISGVKTGYTTQSQIDCGARLMITTYYVRLAAPTTATDGLAGCFQSTPPNTQFVFGFANAVAGSLATLQIGFGPSCASTATECSDGANNDFDSLTDYPFDPGCASADDPSELNPDVECDNGIDDDQDGVIDDVDRGCDGPLDLREDGACDNGRDDDRDRVSDLADPGCASRTDASELGTNACDNGIDDDQDGKVDVGGAGLPGATGDPVCTSPSGDDESDAVELRVVLDGPGDVDGLVSGSCPGRTAHGDLLPVTSDCTAWYPRGTTVRLTARELAPGAFRAWMGCAADGVVCSRKLTGPTTLYVRFDPVRTYAPRVYLHGDENAFPEDPARFITRSRLMWFNELSRTLHPCVRNARRRVLVSASPIVSRIKAGGYAMKRFCWVSGAYRPPKHFHRTFTSAPLTAPAARGQAPKATPGRFGFYLELGDHANWREGVRPPLGSTTYDNAPPMYYEYTAPAANRPHGSITYWFFHAANTRRGDRHQGDWEHVVVRLNDHNTATSVAYFNHYCPGKIVDWQTMNAGDGNGTGVFDHVHPIVYSAAFGHGLWPNPGTTAVTCWPLGQPKPGGLWDKRARKWTWDTWTRSLRDARTQDWYSLGVGWGREGGIGWGPVGPGKHKADVLPRGW